MHKTIYLRLRQVHPTRALRSLVGVVLSLDPEGKEKGSWWHSMSDLVLIARDAVILLIVALVSVHMNAQNTKLGHYSTAFSTRSEARMTRGWNNRLSGIGRRLRCFQAASDKF